MMDDKTVFTFDKVSIEVWRLSESDIEVSFNWVEPSSYCMHQDTDYSADITKDQAIGIIKALKEAFDL